MLHHYQQLQKHLYPGDGKEAVAVAVYGRNEHGPNSMLLVREIFLIPYDACFVREGDNVQWPTEIINHLIEKAATEHLGLLKIHCHPGGYENFSLKDDESDNNLFTSISAWIDDGLPHASCIMLPDGRIFGRFFSGEGEITHVSQISVTGHDIINWHYSTKKQMDDSMQVRNMQAFGQKTVRMLNHMKCAVIGCSGTGSPVIEQLKRLGAGELVLVDPDFVDFLNLNRIINATKEDAKEKRLKVDVMNRAVNEAGFGTLVTTFPTHLSYPEVVKELASCDVLFSCVDGAEGRHLLNLISSYYLIPLFDMGVKLLADGEGGIDGIYGTVHYIRPGGSSLLSREQYDMETVRAESLKRIDKAEFERNRYLAKVNESSPAVISVNMQVAATAVNEFLARIHPYRNIANEDVDAIRILFSDCSLYYESFPTPCPYFSRFTGVGDIEPLLNNIELSYAQKTEGTAQGVL